MAPTPSAQIEPSDHGDATPFSTPHFGRSFRRNSSLSSSPSFSSNSSSNASFSFLDDSPFSPCRTPVTRFSGVPFSWERIPGKPKTDQGPRKEELPSSTTLSLLPLPPAGNSSSNNSSFRKSSKEAIVTETTRNISPRTDPFFVALVECSKDDRGKYWKGSSKVAAKGRLSDRFGFVNMYASCRRTCAVSESIVFLPRSSRPYKLINYRR